MIYDGIFLKREKKTLISNLGVATLCALIGIGILCSCSGKTQDDKKTTDKLNYTETESTEYNQNIPVISSDRLHIEDGCLKSIDGLYEKEEILQIPNDVTSIDKKAMVYKGEDSFYKHFTTSQTLYIKIPVSVKLTKKNFYLAGPLNISFEEGRKVIEEGAFADAGCSGRCVKITLPDSCQEIKKRVFCDCHGKIILNDGLKIIGEYGLANSSCDLPDSIEELRKHALDEWKPATIESNPDNAEIMNFKLPKQLRFIGDECVKLTDYQPGKPIYIPMNVEHIGKNAFEFLTYYSIPKNKINKIKFKVVSAD